MNMSSSAMVTAADDDWVDVAEEFCGPEEWVVLVGDEGSMSAVFFGRAVASIGAGVAAPIPIFPPADGADAARSCGRVSLPGGVTGGGVVAAPAPISIAGPGDAVAASRGRVLLSGPWSRYHVLDPSSGERLALPPPRRAGPHDAAIACDARGGCCWVVCAFRGCFEIYASSTGKWREVPSAAAAGVVPGSAASFAGCVFWKLAASAGVLALDVATGTTREIESPPRCCSEPAVLWQLGVAAGHLCAAVRAGGGVELHGLGPGPTWELLHGICGLAVDGADLRPLRFESDNYEVLLRIGERVVALDILEGTAREARLDGAVLPEDGKIVPWCRSASTLLL